MMTHCARLQLYASSAEASSEYSSSLWAASQATGEPSWSNRCSAGLGYSWAPAEHTMDQRWLRLTFDTALYVSAIHVWEAAQPKEASGFVRRAVAIEPDGTPHEYWSGDDNTNCGSVFSLTDEAQTSYPVAQVMLYTQTQSIGYEHIDAVRIDGTTCPPSDPCDCSSVETGCVRHAIASSPRPAYQHSRGHWAVVGGVRRYHAAWLSCRRRGQ